MVPKPVPRDAFFLSAEEDEVVDHDFKILRKVLGVYGHVGQCGTSNQGRSRLSATLFIPSQGLVGGSITHNHSKEIQGSLPVADRLLK